MIRRYSLRSAVILPFTIVLMCTLGVLMVAQKKAYEEMIQELSQKQLNVAGNSIRERTLRFLHEPFSVNLAMGNDIAFEHIAGKESMEHMEYFLHQSLEHATPYVPQVNVMAYGGANGQTVGFRRITNTKNILLLKDPRTLNKLTVFEGDTVNSPITVTLNDFDPTDRPWYTPVEKNSMPQWSSVYLSLDGKKTLALSALMPIFQQIKPHTSSSHLTDPERKFLGVLVSDIDLEKLTQYLIGIQKESNFNTFIFDDEKLLISQSTDQGVINPPMHQLEHTERLGILENRSLLLQKAADTLFAKKRVQHIGEIKEDLSHFSFTYQGERYFSQLIPITDKYGLQWYISLSIPESELAGDLPQKQRNTLLIALLISAIISLIGMLIFNHIIEPIKTIALAAQSFSEGNWTAKPPEDSWIKETHLLVQSFYKMTENVKQSFQALHTQLIIDPLTSLYSRQGLLEICESYIVAAHDKKEDNGGDGCSTLCQYKKSSLTQPSIESQPDTRHSMGISDALKDAQLTGDGLTILIGIERVRDIRDSLGHTKGDQVLRVLAKRLKEITPKDAYLGRVADAEFAIYIPYEISNRHQQRLTASIKRQFASPIKIDTVNILASPVIGSANTTFNQSGESWLRDAGVAMSNAKHDPMRVTHYQPEMADASIKRTQLVARITHGIRSKEFVPYYQAIIDLSTGEVIGAEALARWHSEEHGMIPPVEFIPVAEEYGLIHQIGQQILFQSCMDAQHAISTGALA